MTKTIYTHKSKGTKLTLVEAVDAKTSIVLNEEGVKIPMANITLSRWYDSEEVEVVETQPEVETKVEATEVKAAPKKGARKMITLDEVIESSYISASFTGKTEDEELTADIYVYGHGKFTRTEAVIYLGADVYRFGTVMTYEGEVVSSYYLLNDSKVGLETIQRKGVNSAVAILSDQLNLSGDLLKSILMKSRSMFQGL